MASRHEARLQALEEQFANLADPRGGAPSKADAIEQLALPEPIGLQHQWFQSAASRKVLRVGRRGGKSRFAMLASLMGHGPETDDGPLFPGVLDGGDVAWVALDYPNLTTTLWREEFLPRFRGLSWATTNSQDHFVTVPGLGSLYLRSAEAIDGLRGIGKNLRGVIIDEAAHLDLERALQDVILPALLDNNGWLILMSTTNAGWDGNTARRLPSYFNQLCAEIQGGDRSAEWETFHGTAFDNPVIDNAGIDELVAEYAPDSAAMRQEVHAELLVGGVGLALPMIDRNVHLVDRFPPAPHWRQFGAFDWGYNHPWVFCWFTMDEDGTVYLVDTLSDRHDLPEQIASKVRGTFPVDRLRPVIAGHDAFVEKGRAIGHTGPTIAETMRKAGLRLVAGDIRRVQGLDNLRRYLAHDDGRPPRFQLMDTEGNRKVLAQLSAMQLNPHRMEDALKVDATESGEGGDDYYDAIRYGLMQYRLHSRPPPPEPATRAPEHFDPEADENFDRSGERRAMKRRGGGRGAGGVGRAPLSGSGGYTRAPLFGRRW